MKKEFQYRHLAWRLLASPALAVDTSPPDTLFHYDRRWSDQPRRCADTDPDLSIPGVLPSSRQSLWVSDNGTDLSDTL